MLSDRRQRVLAVLIEEYVAQALPVGSRTLTERYNLGVSPATVRNELSYLEDAGYISQPHTSAGRIPTDLGYRTFVDNLLANGAISHGEDDRELVERLKSSASELDELLDSASSALARLTDCLSIVVAPLARTATVKQITLISLSDRQAVVVVVTKDAQVYNRQMEFAEAVEPERLSEVQRILNDFFAGRSARDVKMSAEGLSNHYFGNPLVRLVIDEIIACLHEHDTAHAHRIGMSSLARKPEFSESSALIPIMQVLEDDAVLLQILDPTSDAERGTPMVRIGSENPTEQLSGVSVVANRYGRGDSAGVVAVIGPTRMDYSRVLKAVRIASAALDED